MKHNTLMCGKSRNSMSGAGGFSLIEMLIGSAVFIVVLLALYIIIDTSQRTYASGVVRSDVQENVRVVLESMARELRMAGYAPSNSSNTDCPVAPCGVTAVTSSSATFQADLDGDNLTDKLIYTFVPPADPTRPCDSIDPATVGKITRSTQTWTVGAWSPATPTAYDIAQCVKTMAVTSYDGAGVATTIPASVRRIKISITGEENARGQGPRAYTLSTDIQLRNL